jgi:hypothetical protein
MARRRYDWIKQHQAQLKFEELNSEKVANDRKEAMADALGSYIWDSLRYSTINLNKDANIIQPTDSSH